MVTELLNDAFKKIEDSPYNNCILFIITWLVLQICYWGFCIPYTILLYKKIPFFEQYKIQQDVVWDASARKKAFGKVFANIALWTLFLPCGPALLLGVIGDFPTLTPIPSWTTIIALVFFCQVMEDFTFYWSHRLLHEVPYLYKNIHKQHHEFTSPFAWTAVYAHPLEFLLGNVIPASAGVLVLLPFGILLHPIIIWSWLALRLWYTTDVHCGYSFPWAPEKIFGIVYAGPAHHDYHHKAFNGNYSSTLRYLDLIFGTEIYPPKKEIREKIEGKKHA